MDTLDNQLVADTFPADGQSGGAQLGPIYNSNGGYYIVADNDVYAQYAYGTQGDVWWTDSVFIPIGPAILEPGTVGVRFANRVAGQAAHVSGSLSEHLEPSVQITSGGTSTPTVIGQQPNFRVSRINSDQSIPSGVSTNVIFDSVLSQTDAFWTAGSPDRVTIPTTAGAGIYCIICGARFAAAAGGNTRQLLITETGSNQALDLRPPSAGAITVPLLSVVLLSCAVGDVIIPQAFQDSGGPLNLSRGTTFQDIYLQGFKVHD